MCAHLVKCVHEILKLLEQYNQSFMKQEGQGGAILWAEIQYVSLETEFESFIFEFELLKLNNSIKVKCSHDLVKWAHDLVY